MKRRFSFFIVCPFVFSAFLAAFPFSCSLSRDGGVFKSTERGENWQQKITVSENQNIGLFNILTISIDPADSQTLYLGTRSEGIYKSENGGDSWSFLNDKNGALNKRANVYDFAIDQRNTNIIFIGTYQDKFGRFFRSSDGGASWEETYRVSRTGYAIFAVAIDPVEDSIIYMGTAEGGFLKSADYGKTWNVIEWFDDVITDIKVNPRNASVVYVSTFRQGAYKSLDKGNTWQKLEQLGNFPESDGIKTLVMDSHNPDVLYVGSRSGLLKSSDGGINWQKISIVIPPESVSVQAVALDPSNTATLYYAAGNVIYRSDDGGQNWSVHPMATSRRVKIIAVDLRNSNILYAGMHDPE